MLKIILFLLFNSLLFAEVSKETLTIYTYDSFTSPWGTAPQIKDIFEKKYNCNLKFVSTSSSIGALRKIQMERRRTKADILLGLDTSLVAMANKTRLFVPHHIDTSKLKLPIASIEYEDKNFVPYDYNYFSFIYNSKKVKNPPTSFEALIKMPKNFKIIIQDPRSSTVGFGLLLWIKKRYGNQAKAYWQKLAPHILTITKGWSEAYGLFLRGEAEMVLSYTTSPAYHIIHDKKEEFKSVVFKAGHYGQIEVASILKSSKHKVLARKFLKFMHSKAFAEVIPTTNWSYPVIPVTLPEAFNQLVIPSQMLLLPSKEIEKNRKKYINEWLSAIKR